MPEEDATYRGRQLALARYNLGLLLLNGDGTEQDVPQAVTLFRTASDHDCALATNQLARCRAKGSVSLATTARR